MNKKWLLFTLIIAPMALCAIENEKISCFSKNSPFSRVMQKTIRQTFHKIFYSIPDDYIINLMWINKNLDKNQQQIYRKDDVVHGFINPIIEWAVKNPNSTVHVSFDSKHTPQKAIDATRDLIEGHRQDYLGAHCPIAPIILCDTQNLDEVKKHPHVFSSETPVYLRADLLRIIKSHEDAKKDNKISVYADLDVKPMSAAELFDPETNQQLHHYGMVLNHHLYYEYENQFHIITPHNKNMLKAIKYAQIKLNINRTQKTLQDKATSSNNKFKTPITDFSQIVYFSYDNMFRYWYHLEGQGALQVVPNRKDMKKCIQGDTNICNMDHIYDKKIDGLYPFGMPHPGEGRLYLSMNETLIYPTKQVTAPRALGNYNE